MKTRILILFLLVSSLSVFPLSVNADEGISIDSQDLPSGSLPLVESNSMMSSEGAAAYSMTRSDGYLTTNIDENFDWGSIVLPGENGSWGGAGNMGGNTPEDIPVGDASIPIILSLFALYWVFKGTTSKRKNVM